MARILAWLARLTRGPRAVRLTRDGDSDPRRCPRPPRCPELRAPCDAENGWLATQLGGLVGLEDEHILVCTSKAIWKGKDMLRDPRVALSVTDIENPYRMAAIQGRVVEVRPDESCRYMDPISYKYTGAPFPSRGPDRVCFVIAVEKAAQRTLGFTHNPV